MFVFVLLLFLSLVISLCTADTSNLNSTDLDDISNYVIVLPNGEIRPALLNDAFRDWETEEPLGKIQYSTGRIIGGRRASGRSEIPYQVGIMVKSTGIHCGGAIYNEDTVISAAHCFNNQKLKNMVIVAGKFNMLEAEPKEALSVAKSVLIHPDYTKAGGVSDLAIVKLKVPLCFNDFVQPIPITESGAVPKGEATISGWGYIKKKKGDDKSDDNSQYSRQLKLTKITIYTRDECTHRYRSHPKALVYAVHETVFCGGAGYNSDDACQGDSGGPVSCVGKDGQPTLCGIISTGIGCGLPSTPAFYVDLSNPPLNQWIRDNAGNPGPACNWTEESEFANRAHHQHVQTEPRASLSFQTQTSFITTLLMLILGIVFNDNELMF